jgi:hypothetical protein
VKRYSRAELVAFLRRLDVLLTEQEVLEVVGGAAAVLKYGARAPTKDIDTWNRVPKAVQDAADALEAAGQGVPIGPAGVAEIPNDAELRFKTVSIGLKKLVVRVPDRYDLALSKTIRGYDNDLQVIQEMHEKRPLSLRRLVSLFETEMDGMVTKDKRALRLNVAVLVATLFGDQEGEKAAVRWGVTVPRLKKR